MKEISTGKVIKNDYAAFLMTIGGPIFLAISAFTAAFGLIPSVRGRGGQDVDPQFAVGMCVVAAILTVLLFVLLAKRIAKIKRILNTGPRVTATITDINFFKDRGRVEFQYTHDSHEHNTGAAIMKNKQTETFAVGSQIEVALDPEHPSKAMIVELYCTA